MKLHLLIVLGVTLCSAFPTPYEVCTWESNIKSLVQKLTPNGQILMYQAFSDFMGLFFIGIQPVYDAVGKQYNETVQKLMASSDASKVSQVGSLLGVGNYTTSISNFTSGTRICTNFVSINSLVGSMSQENQLDLMQLLNLDEAGIKMVLPTIFVIHRALDDKIYQQLMNTENPATLNAIASAFGL